MKKELEQLAQYLLTQHPTESLKVSNLKRDIEKDLDLPDLKDTHLGQSEEHYHAERTDLPEPTEQQLNKKLIGQFKDYEIFLVNGTVIRNQIDPDFLGGGNGSRYKFIPINEIWIEDNTAEADLIPYIVHEITEAYEMKNDQLSYQDAHELATELEMTLR